MECFSAGGTNAKQDEIDQRYAGKLLFTFFIQNSFGFKDNLNLRLIFPQNYTRCILV